MRYSLFAVSTAALSALAVPTLAQDSTEVAWGGSNPGGVMYYMVGVAGTELAKDLPDINITQVTTGGSTENAKRLIKGELDMGIVYGIARLHVAGTRGTVRQRRQGHDAARRGDGL